MTDFWYNLSGQNQALLFLFYFLGCLMWFIIHMAKRQYSAALTLMLFWPVLAFVLLMKLFIVNFIKDIHSFCKKL